MKNHKKNLFSIPSMAYWLALWIALGTLLSAFADTDAALDTRVQNELTSLLSRVLPADQFSVQVNSNVETVQDRKLVEGETVTSTGPESNPIEVPLLPGFNRENTPSVQKPPSQSRQIFKSVDRQVLASVAVQIILSETLPDDATQAAKTLAANYLQTAFPGKNKLNFSRIKMLPPPALSGSKTSEGLLPFLPWLLAAILAGLALWLTIKRNRSEANPTRRAYPTVYPPEEETLQQSDLQPMTRSRQHPHASALLPPPSLPEARKGFPAIPATQTFVDRRADLLNQFLAHSEIFRHFYSKLPDTEKAELYAGLRGPAFDSLLQTLKLEPPAHEIEFREPSEDQLVLYKKSFEEFIQILSWQNDQFFGFLNAVTNEEIRVLIQGENSLVIALLLRYISAERSGPLLQDIESETRLEVLSQMPTLSRLSFDEMSEIEKSLRTKAQTLRRIPNDAPRDEVHFWTQILTHSLDQDKILIDIETSRPDLYQKLARFRFKLEDIPRLPPATVTQVIDRFENEELALAFQGISRDVYEYLLGELPPMRRTLIRSQMQSLHNTAPENVLQAKLHLTTKFREVLT